MVSTRPLRQLIPNIGMSMVMKIPCRTNNFPLVVSCEGVLWKSKDTDAGTKQVIDSMATEWTDEKHRLFLNSMEASFIKQLYSNEYGSNVTFGWLSRAEIQTDSSASKSSDVKSQPFGQLKVLHRGFWENFKSERVNSQYENKNESHEKSTIPWVQHFRSPSTAKLPHLKSPAQMGENNVVTQSVVFRNRRPGREATNLEKPSPFCSRKVRKVSIGSITEVSDQNFLDMNVEKGEELSRSCSAKRARNAASPIREPIVPFLLPTSERTVFLKEHSEEDSKGDVESTAESLWTVNQVSPCADQQSNDPKLEGG